jgi:hypothetical protein
MAMVARAQAEVRIFLQGGAIFFLPLLFFWSFLYT